MNTKTVAETTVKAVRKLRQEAKDLGLVAAPTSDLINSPARLARLATNVNKRIRLYSQARKALRTATRGEVLLKTAADKARGVGKTNLLDVKDKPGTSGLIPSDSNDPVSTGNNSTVGTTGNPALWGTSASADRPALWGTGGQPASKNSNPALWGTGGLTPPAEPVSMVRHIPSDEPAPSTAPQPTQQPDQQTAPQPTQPVQKSPTESAADEMTAKMMSELRTEFKSKHNATMEAYRRTASPEDMKRYDSLITDVTKLRAYQEATPEARREMLANAGSDFVATSLYRAQEATGTVSISDNERIRVEENRAKQLAYSAGLDPTSIGQHIPQSILPGTPMYTKFMEDKVRSAVTADPKLTARLKADIDSPVATSQLDDRGVRARLGMVNEMEKALAAQVKQQADSGVSSTDPAFMNLKQQWVNAQNLKMKLAASSLSQASKATSSTGASGVKEDDFASYAPFRVVNPDGSISKPGEHHGLIRDDEVDTVYSGVLSHFTNTGDAEADARVKDHLSQAGQLSVADFTVTDANRRAEAAEENTQSTVREIRTALDEVKKTWAYRGNIGGVKTKLEKVEKLAQATSKLLEGDLGALNPEMREEITNHLSDALHAASPGSDLKKIRATSNALFKVAPLFNNKEGRKLGTTLIDAINKTPDNKLVGVVKWAATAATDIAQAPTTSALVKVLEKHFNDPNAPSGLAAVGRFMAGDKTAVKELVSELRTFLPNKSDDDMAEMEKNLTEAQETLLAGKEALDKNLAPEAVVGAMSNTPYGKKMVAKVVSKSVGSFFNSVGDTVTQGLSQVLSLLTPEGFGQAIEMLQGGDISKLWSTFGSGIIGIILALGAGYLFFK